MYSTIGLAFLTQSPISGHTIEFWEISYSPLRKTVDSPAPLKSVVISTRPLTFGANTSYFPVAAIIPFPGYKKLIISLSIVNTHSSENCFAASSHS